MGGDENDQHPITSGTVEGDTVTIHANTASGREYHLELTADGDLMKGTVKSGTREGRLHVRKRRE